MIIAILWRELLACRLGSCAASAMAAAAKVLPLLHALLGPCAAALLKAWLHKIFFLAGLQCNSEISCDVRKFCIKFPNIDRKLSVVLKYS